MKVCLSPPLIADPWHHPKRGVLECDHHCPTGAPTERGPVGEGTGSVQQDRCWTALWSEHFISAIPLTPYRQPSGIVTSSVGKKTDTQGDEVTCQDHTAAERGIVFERGFTWLQRARLFPLYCHLPSRAARILGFPCKKSWQVLRDVFLYLMIGLFRFQWM